MASKFKAIPSEFAVAPYITAEHYEDAVAADPRIDELRQGGDYGHLTPL